MKRSAMILSAGLGTRMRPLTNKLPKPLIKVAGQTMLDRALDHLKKIGVSHIVVNTHYFAPLVQEHVKDRAIISHEPILLESGGGVQNALPLLGSQPFFVLNGDCVWMGSNSLTKMEDVWDENKMDALLLLFPREKTTGFEGDFLMSPEGKLTRRENLPEAPYIFTGVQILNSLLFQGVKLEPYSLNLIYNKALSKGRLYGIVHQGEWFHIGTPEELAKYEPMIEKLEQV
jgi:MurNAc alpha-1-phosphate uridylyltransferase